MRPFWHNAYKGWYIVAGAFLILSVNYGVRYCFGVFVKPMSMDYHWSRSVISVGASLMILSYGIGGIFSGRLLDRIAPRWILTFGATVVATGFILAGFVETPLQFYLVTGLLCGAGASCLGVVVCGSSVGKWFIKKRGMAIGVASMGIGAGTMILAPFSGFIVKNYGWRAGFICLGIVVLVVGISVAQLLMGKKNPEDYGLLPDGAVIKDEIPAHRLVDEFFVNITLKDVFMDSRFWIMAICYSLAVMTEMAAFVHQVAYAEENHVEKVAAAASLGLIGASSILGRFVFGWLNDRLKDAKYSASIGFLFMAIGTVFLLKADSAKILYVYAIFFGFGYGSLAPMMPYLLADRFGRHVLGRSYGVLTFFAAGIGGGIGPLWGGFIYDRFGSYSYAWQINLVVLIVITFLILKMKPREIGSPN
jgi:sugar phosphate permease